MAGKDTKADNRAGVSFKRTSGLFDAVMIARRHDGAVNSEVKKVTG